MKQRFKLYVEIYEEVVVDGFESSDAVDNAIASVHMRLREVGLDSVITDGGAHVEVSEVTEMPTEHPSARAVTYACFHCGLASVKSLWGPGRITCPNCKQREPSPTEAQAILAVAAVGTCCPVVRSLHYVEGTPLVIGGTSGFGEMSHLACPEHGPRRQRGAEVGPPHRRHRQVMEAPAQDDGVTRKHIETLSDYMHAVPHSPECRGGGDRSLCCPAGKAIGEMEDYVLDLLATAMPVVEPAKPEEIGTADTEPAGKATTSPPYDVVCIAWGPLGENVLEHMDCPVVVNEVSQIAVDFNDSSEPFPKVCKCECKTCRRAWFAAGQPIIAKTTNVILLKNQNPTGDPRFYIWHTKAYDGEAVLWWKPMRAGYTSLIDEAGLYDEAEAKEIARLREPETDIPIDATLARRISKPVVRSGAIREVMQKMYGKLATIPGAEAATARSTPASKVLKGLAANWRNDFIVDMKAIKLLRTDKCLGCGKFSCDSCPAGTSTAIDRSRLSAEASAAFDEVFKSRKNTHIDWQDDFIDDMRAIGLLVGDSYSIDRQKLSPDANADLTGLR